MNWILSNRLNPLLVLLGLLISVFTGCGGQPVPYDYSNLIACNPTSILVVPPRNKSMEVNAPYVFLSTITKPLVEKGYYVFPVSVIDTFFKENGMQTTYDMNSIPLDKIYEILKPDAVLYADIEEWGQEYQVISSKGIVKYSFRLLDGKTGALLWNGKTEAIEQSGDGGLGIAGALVSAIVDQILSSVHDPTVGLSRSAHESAINHSTQGLLSGPYKKELGK
jgi:hypothetical protein